MWLSQLITQSRQTVANSAAIVLCVSHELASCSAYTLINSLTVRQGVKRFESC